jgi:hypothetical protein
MAFGTVNVLGGSFDPGALADQYQAYFDQTAAAGIALFVATTPPIFPQVFDTTFQRIRLLNVALKRRYRRSLVDFYHGITVADMLDGAVHLNDAGEQKRLKHVEVALKKFRLLPRVGS